MHVSIGFLPFSVLAWTWSWCFVRVVPSLALGSGFMRGGIWLWSRRVTRMRKTEGTGPCSRAWQPCCPCVVLSADLPHSCTPHIAPASLAGPSACRTGQSRRDRDTQVPAGALSVTAQVSSHVWVSVSSLMKGGYGSMTIIVILAQYGARHLPIQYFACCWSVCPKPSWDSDLL